MGTLIKLIARIVIGLLWIRFVLKLFAVAASGLIATLYGITSTLIYPFLGIFPNATFAGRFTIEFTTLLAIVVYALIEFILIKLFGHHRGDGY